MNEPLSRRRLFALGAGTSLLLAARPTLAQPATVLEVAVLDGDLALPGIHVQVESPALADGEAVILTDLNGVARLDVVNEGLYDVRVEAPGYLNAALRDIRVAAAETTSVSVQLIQRGLGSGSY